MVDGKCWQCKFYNSARRDQGECRRMPPPWRFVDSGDWCGEFCPTKRAVDPPSALVNGEPSHTLSTSNFVDPANSVGN